MEFSRKEEDLWNWQNTNSKLIYYFAYMYDYEHINKWPHNYD